jgi:hypothetical protein
VYISFEPPVERNNVGHNDGGYYLSEFRPMDTAKADALITRLWPPDPKCTSQSSGQPAAGYSRCRATLRSATVRYLQTLTEIVGSPRNVSYAATYAVTSAVAYEDPLFEHELHRFALGGKVSSTNAAQQPVTQVAAKAVPHTAPTAASAAGSNEPAGITGSANIATLAAGNDWFAPLSVPSFQGAPAVSWSATYGWSNRASGWPDTDPFNLFLKLAYLGKHTEELVSAGVAAPYLTAATKAKYMAEGQHGNVRICCAWVGSNEIDSARTQENFMRDIAPRFASVAPGPPFDMWMIVEVGLGNYDFNRTGFPMSLPRYLPEQIAKSFEFPDDFLKVAPEKAEKMIDSMKTNRAAYLGILVKVSSVPGAHRTSKNGAGYVVENQLQSMELYEDEAMTRLIQKYH